MEQKGGGGAGDGGTVWMEQKGGGGAGDGGTGGRGDGKVCAPYTYLAFSVGFSISFELLPFSCCAATSFSPTSVFGC